MDKEQNAVIGKDAIESLTIGMYDDSRFIYREYVQNAVDQIDQAVKLGFLGKRSEGQVHINIDDKNKRITIEDNATGIKASEVDAVLRNIAQSSKEKGVNKGFRGIGKLGGLAYCDLLIFETSYEGEEVKSRMVLDAKKLRTIINDRQAKESAVEVIDNITTVSTDNESKDSRYFKVILENVSNNDLLNKDYIKEYLRMVAPVPFPSRFIYGGKIREELCHKNYSLDEYSIYVGTEQLYKSYTSTVYDINGRRGDQIVDICTFNFKTPSGEDLLWGWYGISEFSGVIPEKTNPARGLRLRSGNIQIGSESTLVKFHREQRGNFYFFGEVHALHKELVPNARRDYFSENEVLKVFERELSEYFKKELYNLYYFASNVRNNQRQIDKYNEVAAEYKEKKFTDNEEAEKYKEEIEEVLEKAEKAEQNLAKIETSFEPEKEDPKAKIFKQLTKNKPVKVKEIKVNGNEKTKFLTDDISNLPNKDRKLISRIFRVIDNVLTKDSAENLKSKIIEDFQ